MRARLTRYAVPGWGVGELWTSSSAVLAHEFAFTEARFGGGPGPRPGGEVRAGPRSAELDPDELAARFGAYLAGADVRFDDVPIDLEDATPFQRAVAEALRAVPRGEVVSYAELAALAGHPRAQRAVGTFCAHNRFAFVLPCHRVVATRGLGGYGSAGPAVKRRLLALEGVRM